MLKFQITHNKLEVDKDEIAYSIIKIVQYFDDN